MVSQVTNFRSMPEPLPDFDRSLGFIVSDISRLLRAEFNRRVRGHGLTRPQWLLLYYVARQPGASWNGRDGSCATIIPATAAPTACGWRRGRRE